MATAAHALLLLETVAMAAHQDQPPGQFGRQLKGSDQNRRQFERALRHVAHTDYADGDEQRVVKSAGLGVDQRPVGTSSLPCFNRLVRTRMLGGVGRAREKLAFTRLAF